MYSTQKQKALFLVVLFAVSAIAITIFLLLSSKSLDDSLNDSNEPPVPGILTVPPFPLETVPVNDTLEAEIKLKIENASFTFELDSEQMMKETNPIFGLYRMHVVDIRTRKLVQNATAHAYATHMARKLTNSLGQHGLFVLALEDDQHEFVFRITGTTNVVQRGQFFFLETLGAPSILLNREELKKRFSNIDVMFGTYMFRSLLQPATKVYDTLHEDMWMSQLGLRTHMKTVFSLSLKGQFVFSPLEVNIPGNGCEMITDLILNDNATHGPTPIRDENQFNCYAAAARTNYLIMDPTGRHDSFESILPSNELTALMREVLNSLSAEDRHEYCTLRNSARVGKKIMIPEGHIAQALGNATLQLQCPVFTNFLKNLGSEAHYNARAGDPIILLSEPEKMKKLEGRLRAKYEIDLVKWVTMIRAATRNHCRRLHANAERK